MHTGQWGYIATAMSLALAALGSADESKGQVQIQAIIPTSIFPRVEEGGVLKQIVHLKLHNAGPAAEVRVEISLPNRPVITERLGTVPAGDVVKSIGVPDVEQPLTLTASLYAGVDSKPIDEYEVAWQPGRKWTIYHVAVSHHDLGYADYYPMMRRDVREWGIERALRYCRQTDTWDEASRYRWTVETSEPLADFLQSRDKRTWEELVRRIGEGRIELGAIHNSANTDGMSYESLARLFYTPNRYIVDLLGIEPRKTALLDDVVGLTRALPLYSKEADVPYFYHGRNQLQDQLQPASAQPVYYWLAPDGDRQRMTLFRTQHYHLRPGEFGQDLMALDVANVEKLLDQYARRLDWPYDAILCIDSWDFSLPELGKVEQIRDWNAAYAYPQVICATMTMFFDAMNAQLDPARVFVFDRDAPNTWIDQDYSDAEAAGRARQLGYQLPTVEKLATLAMAQGHQGYPWTDIWQAYHRLLMFHEHTNAAYAEGPIYAPPSLQDATAANALYYESEIEMHRRLVTEAEQFAARAEQESCSRLAAAVPTSADQTVVVFNALNWPRSDIVRVDGSGLPQSFSLYDQAARAEVPWQRIAGNTILFLAQDVPSLGYKTYAIAEPRPDSSAATGELRVTGDTLENDYYKVTFDGTTGGIRSLWDRKLGRELVDPEAPYQLNEYLYHHVDGKKPGWHRVESATLTPSVGPVAAVMKAVVKARGARDIVQEVILYRGVQRVDFIQQMEKTSCGRTLDDYRTQDPLLVDHGKEAVFYALPLLVPDFRIQHELAGAVVEPVADQSVGSSTDYYNIQHFADVSNDQFGVTLATLECGLIQYGRPRPSQSWIGESILERPRHSHLYLYLMNNWFGTNIRIDQPGHKTFTWSLRSHPGDWRAGQAYTFGWECSHTLLPLIVNGRQTGGLPAGQHSFLQVDRPNVVLTAMKRAEINGEGFILRFHELAGQASQVTVTIPFVKSIREARETSLIEVDRLDHPIATTADQISFTIRAHGVKTVRLLADAQPVDVNRVVARPLSDMEVELAWEPRRDHPEQVSHYEVYRDTRPDFKVGLANWIGSSTRGTYTDRPQLHYGGWVDNRLEAATTYYYQVRPIDRWNNAGATSAIVSATTDTSDVSNRAPARVAGLWAVPVSPVSHHNYLALWFYTNCESDVTRYRVYRGHSPGFPVGPATLLAEIDATSPFTHTTPHGFGTVTRQLRDYNRILYVDQEVQPATRYYYRVQAVDRQGKAGEPSLEAAAITGIGNSPAR